MSATWCSLRWKLRWQVQAALFRARGFRRRRRHELAAAVGRFKLDYGEQTFIFMVSMFHIYGLVAFPTIPIASGSVVVILPKFEIDEMLMVNHAEVLRIKYDLKSLHTVLSGGAPLSKEVIKRFSEKYGGVTILHGYGLTESTEIGASMDPSEKSRKYGMAGLLSPSMNTVKHDLPLHIYIFEASPNPLPSSSPVLLSAAAFIY